MKRTCAKFPHVEETKRKRLQTGGIPLLSITTPSPKQPRVSPPQSPKNAIGESTVVGANGKETNPLEYWRKEFRWPKEYFEPEINMDPLFAKENPLFAKKKLSLSIREKQTEAGFTPSSATPSDQKPREVKSASYIRPVYEKVLASKGSFMQVLNVGPTDDSKRLCMTLLTAEQSIPQDTLFRDDLFTETCSNMESRNEAMIIRDITPLICPSAQNLRIHRAKHLDSLYESVNEGWNSSIPFYGPHPQPDYSVGFRRSAFTDHQLVKLKPFVGEVPDMFTSYFMATGEIYFPFLTCEVKCGAALLRIADRQNAHSMTLAVRAIVKLFKQVKREKELHREIIAFSISHDDRTVRISGHYPMIDGENTTFYCHEIHSFFFAAFNGKEKWTAYNFVKNVYDIWVPTHLKRICSVIDHLPPNMDLEEGESRLSQALESHHLSDYENQDAASLPEEVDCLASRVSPSDVTPYASASEQVGVRVSKNPRKRGPPVELESE